MSEQNKLDQMIEKYNELETRQRAMILGLVVAVLLVIFDFAWFQPQSTEQARLKRELSSVQTERQELAKAVEQRQQQLMGTAFNQQRKRIKQLQQQEAEVDEALSEYAQLVSPRQMPELLRNFFEKSDRLTLLALDKLPVKPAFKQVANNGSQKNDSNTDNKSHTAGSQKISFYRHDFTVTLRGKYFELLKSLQTLESMNIKIYWDSLDYQVENYPNADIKLTLYTYSYDKNWIGA
jgi:MSHA biogenesis protein MshJ